MSRSVTGLASAALAAVLLAACVATPAPSTLPSTVAPAATFASIRPSASRAASAPPAVDPGPSALRSLEPFPSSTPAAGVPVAIEQFAWAASQSEVGPDETQRAHVVAGLLNHAPTIVETLDRPADYPWVRVAGGAVALVTGDAGHVHVDVRRASDGARIGGTDAERADSRNLVLDPERRLMYVATFVPAGGVEIHRLSFDGSANTVVVALDKRFNPDGIPTERFDMAVDPGGVLVIEACADVGGCRLWEIPPEAATAPAPRTLPGHPPILCAIVAVSPEWLVVQDDAACWADTGDAPLPVRAIHRSDGVSHLVTNDHVSIARILQLGGRAVLVGADGIVAGRSIDVVTYDVQTGKKTVRASGIGPGPADEGINVSPVALPGTWVLLEPWFVEQTAVPRIPARLLDLATGEMIELPLGTAGWT